MATPLKDFRDAATRQEREELATAVETTEEYLFTHLGTHRNVPIEKAEQIEEATLRIGRLNGGRTPVIRREELCEVCARCPRAARGGCA